MPIYRVTVHRGSVVYEVRAESSEEAGRLAVKAAASDTGLQVALAEVVPVDPRAGVDLSAVEPAGSA